jgi:hypothetical protein
MLGKMKIDNVKEYFEDAVRSLDPVVMAEIVDTFLEGYMEREGIEKITKVKGQHVLRRVYASSDMS